MFNLMWPANDLSANDLLIINVGLMTYKTMAPVAGQHSLFTLSSSWMITMKSSSISLQQLFGLKHPMHILLTNVLLLPNN